MKEYEMPKAEVIVFDTEDIITDSDPDWGENEFPLT